MTIIFEALAFLVAACSHVELHHPCPRPPFLGAVSLCFVNVIEHAIAYVSRVCVFPLLQQFMLSNMYVEFLFIELPIIGAPHLRDIFYRMGLSDKDIVALSGAHTLVNIPFVSLYSFSLVLDRSHAHSVLIFYCLIGKGTSGEIWF